MVTILGALKKIEIFFIQNFFLAIVFVTFRNKLFLGPCYLNKKLKLCRACGQIRRIFGIRLIKIYLIGSIESVFENPKHVIYHSTLLPSFWMIKACISSYNASTTDLRMNLYSSH